MPEHVHLLLSEPQGSTPSNVLRDQPKPHALPRPRQFANENIPRVSIFQ